MSIRRNGAVVSLEAKGFGNGLRSVFCIVLLALLSFLLAGCGMWEPALDFVVENQMDQPVIPYHKIHSEGQWGQMYDFDQVEPGKAGSAFATVRYPLDSKRKYYIEVRAADGEVVCTWEFLHSEIKGMRVFLVVPGCESYEEGKPKKRN